MFIISLFLIHQNTAFWENDFGIGEYPLVRTACSSKEACLLRPFHGILSYMVPLKVRIFTLHPFLMILKLFFPILMVTFYTIN